MLRIQEIVALMGLLLAGPSLADDGPPDWRQMAQEQLVEIHSHYDWMDTQVGELSETVEWPASTPPYHQELIRQEDFDLPIVVNDRVKYWLDYYLGPGRRTFRIYLSRSSRYETLMRAELKSAGLPQEFIYIAMIESGFVFDATSRAGATGLWQLMPGTAKKYDVRLDWWVDDRMDPLRSTKAAVALLKALKKRWGDWYLVLAAYNAGGRRVKNGIAQEGTRDFWALADAGVFAGQTRHYVPKLIAATILGTYRERYGFTDIPYVPALELDTVELAGGSDVTALAECAKTDPKTLKELNPGLKRWATPAEGYTLKLPKGRQRSFLKCVKEKGLFQSLRFERHTVQSGEFLGGISARYGVKQADILQANQLTDANTIRVGQTLMIPIPDDGFKPTPVPKSTKIVPPTTHRVKTGDSLSKVAKRYGVSVSQVQHWNSLTTSFIREGDTLTIHPPPTVRREQMNYVVESGDTLSSIALRYGVSVGMLQRWNGIHDAGTINAGQRLNLFLQDNRWKEYTVQDGDSLGKIAMFYSCTVKDIRLWNGLNGTLIRPGQRLRIRN